MVRGTPGVKRDRTISVRVSAVEWAAWETRRAASGRREMGAWVRAVVLDAEGLGQAGVAGSAAGDVPVVPEVNEQAYAVLVGAANNLNQLTRYSHQEEALAAGVGAAVAEVVAAARVVRGRPVTMTVTTAATRVVPAPGGPAVEPVAAAVFEQEPTDQSADQSAEQVDPWVSRPRPRTDRLVADAGADLGPAAGVSSAGGGASPLTPQDVEQDVGPGVGLGVEHAAQEGGRPAGWDAMSLVERARWVRR